MHILVIAEEANLRCTLALMLHNAGYVVDTAEKAFQALELARCRAYNILLIDADVPGVNSRAFVAAQQALLPGVPVILLASCSPRKKPFGYHFLIKPIDPASILKAVENSLG
jgi:DNA-binding NtrC family response regulator